MDDTKITKFYESAIAKTKNGLLSWSRVSSQPASIQVQLKQASNSIFGIDSDRSFLTQYCEGGIALLCDKEEDTIYCLIKPGQNLSYQQISEDDNSTLYRLYNIVYSQFPSVDSFIDAFIKDL